MVLLYSHQLRHHLSQSRISHGAPGIGSQHHTGLDALRNIHRIIRSVSAFSREFIHPSEKQQVLEFPAPHRLRLGVALGGGFARGVAHIGVLKALDEAMIPVNFVAGTSVGAIIGACHCAGVSAEELEEVARTARFRDFARWTFSRHGFCSNDRISRFCARVMKASTFEELKVPLAITATDYRTGEAVIFSNGPLAGPIRASCAYPGMFRPVEIDGRCYVDGMLAYAVPTTPLRHMGAECVVGVFLSAHWSQQGTPRHLFEVIGQCFSIAQIKMSEMWKRDDLVLEPDVTGFSFDCFDRSKELIALGEKSMRAVIPRLRTLLNLPVPLSESRPSGLAPVSPPTMTPAPQHSAAR
jgi:NTE family protein